MEYLDELKEQANSFIEAKEYKKAIEVFYNLLTFNASDEETLLCIADVFSKMNNYERSKDYYLKILTLNESSLPALRGIARLYRQYKKFDKALSFIDKALEIEQNTQDVEFKALLLIKLNKNQEALDMLSNLLKEKESDCIILNSIALCYFNLGDFENTIEYYNNSITIKPTNAAWLGLSKVYLESDINKAQEILENILEKDFNDIKAHYLLAEVFYKQKKYEKAIAEYNFILTIKKNDIKALDKLGITYSEIGWHEQAIEVYQDILKISPSDKEIRYALAYTYFIMQDYSKAKKELSKNNEHINSFILQAQIAFNEDKFASTIEILENLVKENNIPQIPELLGKAYDAIDLKDKALSCYELAIKLGSKDIETKYKLALAFKQNGDNQKSYDLLDAILDEEEYHIEANLLLAEVLFEFENYETVLVLLNKLIEKNQNIVEVYPIGAKASMAIDNFDLAKDFLYESIKKDPSNPQGYYLTGIFMEKMNEPDEAEVFYEEALSLDINNVIYINAFADYYYKYYDFENAVKLYKKSLNIKIDEQIEEKYLNCLVELKQLDKLKRYLKKAKSKKLDALFMIHK